jgi:hypothetical protein
MPPSQMDNCHHSFVGAMRGSVEKVGKRICDSACHCPELLLMVVGLECVGHLVALMGPGLYFEADLKYCNH